MTISTHPCSQLYLSYIFDGHLLFVRIWIDLALAGRVTDYDSMPASSILLVCVRQGDYVKHRWRGGGAGERGRDEWCGRGWMDGPSVCSERTSGRTGNLRGTRWLTGRCDTAHQRAKRGSEDQPLHADESRRRVGVNGYQSGTLVESGDSGTRTWTPPV